MSESDNTNTPVVEAEETQVVQEEEVPTEEVSKEEEQEGNEEENEGENAEQPDTAEESTETPAADTAEEAAEATEVADEAEAADGTEAADEVEVADEAEAADGTEAAGESEAADATEATDSSKDATKTKSDAKYQGVCPSVLKGEACWARSQNKPCHYAKHSIPMNNKNVYVCHLPLNFTKGDLDKMFSKFGKVEDSKILVDKRSGRSRGVGFVHYGAHEHALAAINDIDGTNLNGHNQTLHARFAKISVSRKRRRASPPRMFARPSFDKRGGGGGRVRDVRDVRGGASRGRAARPARYEAPPRYEPAYDYDRRESYAAPAYADEYDYQPRSRPRYNDYDSGYESRRPVVYAEDDYVARPVRASPVPAVSAYDPYGRTSTVREVAYYSPATPRYADEYRYQ